MTGPIFVSHSTSDRNDVEALCDALRGAFKQQIRLFHTSSGIAIPAGTPWREVIIDVLRESSFVVLWGTPAAIQSKEVAFEMGAAFAFGKPVVPCAVHVSPRDLPWSLAELQAVTLDETKGWRFLADTIANQVGYQQGILEAPLLELARKFAAPNDALGVEVVGRTIKLENRSDSRISKVGVTSEDGAEVEWAPALHGLTLEPHEFTILLRDAAPQQQVRFAWTDVAGAPHARAVTVPATS